MRVYLSKLFIVGKRAYDFLFILKGSQNLIYAVFLELSCGYILLYAHIFFAIGRKLGVNRA